MQKNKIDVSIIIISYNTAKMTLDAINSVYNQTNNINYEIIVVDNASFDGSPDLIEDNFPNVNLIRSDENLGFAKANNIASKTAKGRYLLLLNSDTVILDGAIQKLFNYAEDCADNVGLFGGSTFFSDGSRNPSSCWNEPTLWSTFCIASGLTFIFNKVRFFNSESYSWWDWSYPIKVDIVSGCFLMIRKHIWDKLNGFSPDFFMYGEDADLCTRANKMGYSCRIYPDVKLIHYGGASNSFKSERFVKLFKGKNFYIRKHNLAPVFIEYLFDFWALTRTVSFYILGLFSKRKKEQYNEWKAILKNRNMWHTMNVSG